MNIGIYLIRNKKDGKVYIGKSLDIKNRWNSHRSKLKRNVHGNRLLQKAYNEYGKENFEYKAVEYCEENELDEKEIYWIKIFKATDRKYGYNLEYGGSTNKKFAKDRKERVINEENCRRLTVKEVSEIKRKLVTGIKQSELSKEYNIKLTTINKIARCENWKWVNEELNYQLINLKKNNKNYIETKAKELYKEYKSVAKISEILNIDRRVVERILEKELEDYKQYKEKRNEKIIKEFKDGVPKEEIIKNNNITKTIYYNLTKDLGKSEACKNKEKLIKDILEYKKQGYSNKYIADKFNIHRTTVTEYLKKHAPEYLKKYTNTSK